MLRLWNIVCKASKNELEINWKQAVVAKFEVLPQLFMEGLMKTTKCWRIATVGHRLEPYNLRTQSRDTKHLTVVTYICFVYIIITLYYYYYFLHV